MLSIFIFAISFYISGAVLNKFNLVKNKIYIQSRYLYIILKYIFPFVVVCFISFYFVNSINSLNYTFISRVIYGFFACLISRLFTCEIN